MRKWLVIGFLAMLAQLAGAAPHPSSAVPSDPCAGSYSPQSASLCSDFTSCGVADRVLITCQLRDFMLKQYAPLIVKQERLSLNPEKHLNGCIEREKTLPDNLGSLQFADRIQECLAAFRDTHLRFDTQIPLPLVFTGIRVREIGGKFYIADSDPKLITHLRDTNKMENLDQHLAVGNEVVEVDGKSPAFWRDNYKKYISGSSEAFRSLLAVEAILQRNFDYPKKDVITLKIKDVPHPIQLPWWTTPTNTSHPAATKLLKNTLHIPSTDRVNWEYNYAKHAWERASYSSEGYFDVNPIVARGKEDTLKTYSDELGSDILRTGEVVVKGGRAFGYLQILSFEAAAVRPKGELGTPTSDFIEVIRGFVKSCKQNSMHLVIDLRANAGGIIDYPEKLLALVLPKGQKTPGKSLAFRVTSSAGLALASMKPTQEVGGKYVDDNTKIFEGSTFLFDEFEKAVEQKAIHTNIIVSPPVAADKDVDGFPNKLVVLTSPACVSACDLFVALIKRTGRATIVGTPTNGAGAGYVFSSFIDANWRDTTGFLKLRIPNTLVGVTDKEYKNSSLPFENYKNTILIENRPTLPDRTYSPTVDDLKGTTTGWVDTVGKIFFGK